MENGRVGSGLVPTSGSYVVIGLVAAAVTFTVTPLVGMFARRMGWVYLPNDRTVHETPLPDIGGLAMKSEVIGPSGLSAVG